MGRRFVLILFGILMLTGCGALVTAEAPPLPTPVIIRQVVTSIVIQTQIVTQVVTATPKPATPTPKATATPKIEATATIEPSPAPSASGKWVVTQDKSSFDDSTTVVLALDADADISGPLGDVRPTLVVRCKEHQKEIYVVTEMQPDVESDNLDGATVRLRFDSDAAQSVNTSKSTDGEALFLPNAQQYINALLKHEHMVFGFTPFNESPKEMTFDLRGLSEVIQPLNEACR